MKEWKEEGNEQINTSRTDYQIYTADIKPGITRCLQYLKNHKQGTIPQKLMKDLENEAARYKEIKKGQRALRPSDNLPFAKVI